MLTYIKKNLIIAALEDSLLTGKKAAGIATLAEMETLLAALRSRVNADPDAVTDKSIWQMYARLNALKFPSVSNIWWAFNDLSMFDRVETDTIGWSNITGKPAKFPPTAHTHDYASITDKPTTFEPSAHDHDYASITGKPAKFPPAAHSHVKADVTDFPTAFPPAAHSHVKADVTDFPTAFPPAAHSHVKADVTDFPTTMPPSAHSHAYADITSKPTTFAPSAHSHAYADITSKPTTFAPSAHSHAVTAYVRYSGNGAASRVLTLSASIMPAAILIMRDDAGMAYYWSPPLGASLGGNAQLYANAISVTAGTVTLTSAIGNGNGNIFSLIAWGNAV